MASKRGSGRMPRLAAVLSAVLGAVVLHPAAASADTSGSYLPAPSCNTSNGVYECQRYGEAWQTNSAVSYNLGYRGARQTTKVNYSPNNTRPNRDIVVDINSQAWDQLQLPARIRLAQTVKALNTSGAAISVGWGIVNIGGTDPTTVSSNQVYLSMTRTKVHSISRSAALSFPHNFNAHRVEQVSSSTIEYATSNVSHRLLTQLRLTSY